MVTIKDVAKKADVSIATVSNYLNRTKPVSKELGARIQNAVDELGYSLNLNAKILKTAQYMDIGVILPSLNDSYYVQLFQGIKTYFQNTNYFINLVFSNNIPELEVTIAQNLKRKQICGLILVSCQPENWKFYYDNFTSKKIPLVLIDRKIYGLETNFVSCNNRVLIRNMVDELLKRKMENIFLLSGPEKFYCELECMKGMRDAFENNGKQNVSDYFIQTNMGKEDAFRKTLQLLKRKKPDAIVTTSESLALGIIEGIRLIGYTTVDIPIFTLGEQHWNLHTHSFATNSLVRPAMNLGKTASKLLLEQLESPLTKESEKIILAGCSSDWEHEKRYLSVKKKPESEQKKLRVLMLDTPQVESISGLILNFEKRTGIKMEIITMPHNELYNTILTTYSENQEKSYDVFMYDMPWLSFLAAEGILEDISDKMKEMDLELFFPGALKYYSMFNGRYFGIPFMYAPQVLFYRKDLFEDVAVKKEYEKQNNISLRPPVTLKEFNTISEFFSDKTNIIEYGTSIPTAYNECLTPEVYMRLKAFGGHIFDQEGNVVFESDQTLRAYINFLRAIKFAKPDYRIATDMSAAQDFIDGKIAMLISYPSFLRNIPDLRKNSMIGSIGYHLIPGRTPLLGGWSLGINQHSSNKEEAFQFLKWTCEEQTANYTTLLGGLTVLTNTYVNDELSDLYPWLPLYYSIYQYTKPVIPPKLLNNKVIPQWEIDEVVCKWLYKLLDSEIEVRETISETQKALQILAKQYK